MKKVLMYRTFGDYLEVPDEVYAKLEAGGKDGDDVYLDPEPVKEYMRNNDIFVPHDPESEVYEEFEVLCGPWMNE